jgi:hypothetical protein
VKYVIIGILVHNNRLFSFHALIITGHAGFNCITELTILNCTYRGVYLCVYGASDQVSPLNLLVLAFRDWSSYPCSV